MFCPKCGSNIPDEAVRCKHCGANTAPFASSSGNPQKMSFCSNCGSQIAEEATACVHCGVSVRSRSSLADQLTAPNGKRSWTTTLLLCCCLFFGFGGLHRFYTGHVLIGLIQLFTGGGCMIWQLIDLLCIITGSYRDAEGRELFQ